MAYNTGVKYSGTIVSSTNWTNYTVAQVGSDNAAYAYTLQTTSQPAVSRNYDFSAIPADAIIEGIVVEVQISSNNATRIAYMKVRYSVDGGANWSAYKPEQSQTGTTDSTKTFGGAADLWGLTPTAAQIKDATNFRIDTAGRSNNASYRCRVDFVRVTVYYHRAFTQSLTEALSFSISLANLIDFSLSDVMGVSEEKILRIAKINEDSVAFVETLIRRQNKAFSSKVHLIIQEENHYQEKQMELKIQNIT